MEFDGSDYVDDTEGDRQNPKVIEKIYEDRRAPKCHLRFRGEKEKFVRPIGIDKRLCERCKERGYPSGYQG